MNLASCVYGRSSHCMQLKGLPNGHYDATLMPDHESRDVLLGVRVKAVMAQGSEKIPLETFEDLLKKVQEEEKDTGWQHAKKFEHTEVYRKSSSDSSVHVFKVHSLIKLSCIFISCAQPLKVWPSGFASVDRFCGK